MTMTLIRYSKKLGKQEFEAYNSGVDYIKLLYPCDAFAIIKEYSKTEYNNTNYKLPTGKYVFSTTEKNMVYCNLNNAGLFQEEAFLGTFKSIEHDVKLGENYVA